MRARFHGGALSSSGVRGLLAGPVRPYASYRTTLARSPSFGSSLDERAMPKPREVVLAQLEALGHRVKLGHEDRESAERLCPLIESTWQAGCRYRQVVRGGAGTVEPASVRLRARTSRAPVSASAS